MADSIWHTPRFMAHTQVLLDSYEYWLKRSLLERSGNPGDEAERLFHAPFVVVSHGTGADPIFNYANRAALELFEMELDVFLRTPSRQSAEAMHRDERRRMLERADRDGYIDDYRGTRISRTGKRFHIERAVIWNLRDARARHLGQAATFSRWAGAGD